MEFQLRAMDELGSLTLFAPEAGSAFCPYDGGMDLFLPAAETIDLLRRRFNGWLPANPDGL